MRGRRRKARVFAVLAVLLVASCSVTLVSDYDEQIDSGLSQLNTDITAFVNKMIDQAGTPQGTWASNKDFYTTQEAKVDTTVVRAQAHRALGSCPSTEVVTAAISSAVPASDVSKYVGQIPKDDCSVVLLQLVKSGVTDLEAFH